MVVEVVQSLRFRTIMGLACCCSDGAHQGFFGAHRNLIVDVWVSLVLLNRFYDFRELAAFLYKHLLGIWDLLKTLKPICGVLFAICNGFVSVKNLKHMLVELV